MEKGKEIGDGEGNVVWNGESEGREIEHRWEAKLWVTIHRQK